MEVLTTVAESKPLVVLCLIDSNLFHFVLREEGKDVFLIAFPDSAVSAKDAIQIVRDTSRLLQLRYRTLANAFSRLRRSGQEDLNEIFFSMLREKEVKHSEYNFESFQWLNLPDEVRFQVDDATSQFASADFQESRVHG